MKQTVEMGGNSQGNSPSLATVLSNLSWGGNGYSAYEGRMDVTPGAGAGAGSGGSGGSGAPAGGGAAASSGAAVPGGTPPPTQGAGQGTIPAGGQAAPPAAGGSGGAAPAPNPNDANLAELRTNYEQFRQLGELPAVQAQVQAFRGLVDRYAQVGDQLGYEADSVREMMAKDPIGVMRKLNSEWANHVRTNPQATNGQPDLQKLIDQRVAPLEQHIASQRADAAEKLVQTEFGNLISGHDLLKGDAANPLPTEIKDVIYDMVTESMKYDEDALKRLYNEGKTSDVKKYFDGVAERFFKVINSYNAWQAKLGRAPGQTGQGGQPTSPTQGLTLDDVIYGNEKAAAAFKF